MGGKVWTVENRTGRGENPRDYGNPTYTSYIYTYLRYTYIARKNVLFYPFVYER